MSVELLRLEFRIVGLRRNDQGVPEAEVLLGEGTAHAAGLDDLPASVRRVVDEAQEQESTAPALRDTQGSG